MDTGVYYTLILQTHQHRHRELCIVWVFFFFFASLLVFLEVFIFFVSMCVLKVISVSVGCQTPGVAASFVSSKQQADTELCYHLGSSRATFHYVYMCLFNSPSTMIEENFFSLLDSFDFFVVYY